MKKKTLAMLIGAAMVTAAITGCTSGSKETEAPATETVTEGCGRADRRSRRNRKRRNY